MSQGDAVRLCPWCDVPVVFIVRGELVSLVHHEPFCEAWGFFVGSLADAFGVDPAYEAPPVDSRRTRRRA